ADAASVSRVGRGRGAAGGTGVTRTPPAGRAGAAADALDGGTAPAAPAERVEGVERAEGAGAVDRGAGAAARRAAPGPPAAPDRGARWTDGGAGDGAAPRPLGGAPDLRDAPARAPGADEADVRTPATAALPVAGAGAGAGPWASEVSAGIARRGATGIRCTDGAPGGVARGVADQERSPDGANAPDNRPSLAAGSSTAGDSAAVNDGFCQVGSRPPKPASATPVRGVAPVARWIGGSPVHSATTVRGAPVVGAVAPSPSPPLPPVRAPPEPDSAAVPAALPVTASEGGAVDGGTAPLPAPPAPWPSAPWPSVRRPRSRSRNPTDQPSAMPRVTRDAI
ncbi:hypothetical protein ACWD6I_30125, partial [Streptomyces sp. NPDC002454]